MGTAAHIAIKTGEDEYRLIYCHYDGYPSHLGKLLVERFRSVAAVTALIDGGDVMAVHDLHSLESQYHSLRWCHDDVMVMSW